MRTAMNCYRMIQGYVVHVNEPGGAVAYIGDLRRWDHIFKDTLYATQEIFGDGVAVRIAHSGSLLDKEVTSDSCRFIVLGSSGTATGKSSYSLSFFSLSAVVSRLTIIPCYTGRHLIRASQFPVIPYAVSTRLSILRQLYSIPC